MAMETGGRLVELSRPEKNPDRIRRNDQPHDCGDAEFEPDGRGADIEPDALNQIWRKRSGECFHTWNHVRFHRHIDNRLQGRPLLRSEEHTSELQSLTNLVCRLLLEK